ncbi:phage replisome organizer N-terminal domain-containing protein [Planomicrobium sp. CPCC 101079]|uniref:phage replisome organizer N-terminal domain-containing protein n=1 Tax=Planomicrobium sp. CPCC 101079 TaxID=2599618 RepID=UPI002102301D|nr:phage replisome organizer N-terminal domain-containing protein [Planomicrobium sp. CPCC 101079]
MSDVKWIKLSTQMFEDEKIRLIESMPEADTILIVWVKLLSQAGRANANGYIYLSETIPYTDEMLATIFNRPLSTVRMALEVFRNFGMIDVDENHFISISNWEKHQNVAGLDKIREQNRLRKQKERETKRLGPPEKNKKKNEITPINDRSRDRHVTVTPSHATELELDLELELELEEELNIELDKELQQQEKEDLKPKAVVAADSPGMAFRFYGDNIALLTPHIADRLSVMIDESSEELVHEALKRAVEANARHKLNFADSILLSWKSQLIKTLNDVAAADKEFERRKKAQPQNYRNKPIREELLPDWLNAPEPEKAPETVPPSQDLDAEKQKLLEKLASRKGGNKE